jgi:hypothetical protein
MLTSMKDCMQDDHVLVCSVLEEQHQVHNLTRNYAALR